MRVEKNQKIEEEEEDEGKTKEGYDTLSSCSRVYLRYRLPSCSGLFVGR